MPSQAYEGNLETMPHIQVSSSPLPGETFLAPLRDLSLSGKTGEVDRQLDHDSHDESRLALIVGHIAESSEGLSDTPTERLSVNLLTQPLNQNEMSVLRETPAEPVSEQTTIPISTPHTATTRLLKGFPLWNLKCRA